MQKYKIFMVASSATPIRSFIELTKQLEKKISVKVYMLCDEMSQYQRITQENHLDCEEITFIELGDKQAKNEFKNAEVTFIQKESAGKQTWIYKSWRRIYKNSQIAKLLIDIKDIIIIIKRHKNKRVEIDRYFRQYNPDMVILYSDLRRGYESAAIYLAAKYKIPRIIAPVARTGTAEGAILSGGWCYRKKQTDKLSIIEKYVIKRHPGHCLRIKNDFVFRFEPREIAAYAMLGVLPENPWVLGSGNITSIAFISQDDYDYAVSLMGEQYRKKACVTHTIEESDIVIRLGERKEIRENFLQKYKITGSRIVCFALSAYARSSLPIDFEMEKDTFVRIANEMVRVFGTVLISLHPQMNRKDYLYFNEISGCIIVEEPLYKIIPVCDVFIGDSASSVREIVKNINFSKIFIPHEMFLRRLTDEDIKNIKEDALCVKEKNESPIMYQQDGMRDFYDLIIEKFIPEKYVHML